MKISSENISLQTKGHGFISPIHETALKVVYDKAVDAKPVYVAIRTENDPAGRTPLGFLFLNLSAAHFALHDPPPDFVLPAKAADVVSE
ncbi:MAG TPA: hypothetical protein PK967_05695 [Candidatus Hydrogenedentes bacterium]|nr:hypothetical protein [Candidatus Hydrogenedentota bacterium]